MHRFAHLIFLFLFLPFSPRSQEIKTAPGYQQLYESAEKLFNSGNATETTDGKAMAAYLQSAKLLIKYRKFNDTLVDIYLKCGILKMSNNELGPAQDFFHQAMVTIHQNNQLNDSLLFKPYLYAGSIQYSLNNLDSAIYYYKEAEVINARHAGLNESERLFNKFGALYFETGDYNKSISYFEKALFLVENKTPGNVYFIINYQNNIATALMKLGRYSQALEIFRALLKYGKPGDELLYNIGNTYFENGNYPEALKYLKQIGNLELEKYNGLTKIFIRFRQYDSAQYYINRAKMYFQNKQHSAPVLTYGITLKYSGDLKQAQGNGLEALKDYQLAIHYLDPAFTDTSMAENPKSFPGLLNFLYLYETLIAKGATLRSLGNQSPANPFLLQSLGAYESALSLAKYAEKIYFSDDARLFLKTKINPTTQDAVDVAIQLYEETKNPQYMNAAFSFAENNKATVLQAGIKNLELTSIPQLPVALVAEEKKYRTVLAKLNIQSAQVRDSLSVLKLQEKIHDMEVSLATVQDKLDENPVYHNLRFSSSSVNMDSLERGIKDEVILSFYYTSSSLICFYISKDGTGFSSIPMPENLFSTILSLRKELRSPDASSHKYLEEAGATLFGFLMKPVFDKIKNKKRLVIIPFNEISYVPFEMLVNPADGSLMLRKFTISYNYSAAFLGENEALKRSSYRVLGMAPFSVKENPALVMPSLPASMYEINNLPGKELIGPGATKLQFENLSGQFPVLHLATHAVANDTNLLGTFIEFYGLRNNADSMHRLYEQEIYTMDLKSARLVILSACETGNGLLVNGEGVMSLSRAFSYAGCKSIVTSLWKADEISTSFIGKRIHHYLQDGVPIDEALQKSKIDYLESNEIKEQDKSPAYWANLVLIGDFHPVVQRNFHWVIWIAISTFIILMVYVVGKKINRT